MWNSDEAKGKAHQVKGRVEQAAGDLSGDDTLVDQGKADETVGKVETAIGTVAKNTIDGVAHIGDAAKRSKQ